MTSARVSLEACARFVLLIAVFLSVFAGVSLWNRIAIRQHRHAYQQGTFTVSNAHFEQDNDGTEDYGLEGTIVCGKRTYSQEQYVPHFTAATRPTSVTDLLNAYPKGSKINVMFNPDFSGLVSNNGETLRVIAAGPTFWADEEKRFYRYLLFTFAPVPFAVAFLLIVRGSNRRHELVRS